MYVGLYMQVISDRNAYEHSKVICVLVSVCDSSVCIGVFVEKNVMVGDICL